jgi:hypothetical protein
LTWTKLFQISETRRRFVAYFLLSLLLLPLGQ